MTFAPERILVAGGAGFMGGTFVRHWLTQHPSATRIVVLDSLTYAAGLDNVADLQADPRFTMVSGDVRDAALVARVLIEHDIDAVLNFAAESHVDRSIVAPGIFVETNVLGAHVLLQAAAARWLQPGRSTEHRFVQISTDEVYGSLSENDRPRTEEDLYQPNSPYSASKAAADHMVRAYHRTYGLSTLVVHSPNNFGPRQFPEKLVPRVITAALEGQQIPLYGDGLNVREWLHVGDCCAAIVRALLHGTPGERYNLASTISLENRRMVNSICELIDARLRAQPALLQSFPRSRVAQGGASRELIRTVADRPGHDRRYALDATKAVSELSLAAPRGFEAALGDTVDWYLAHPQWWRPRLKGAASAPLF